MGGGTSSVFGLPCGRVSALAERNRLIVWRKAKTMKKIGVMSTVVALTITVMPLTMTVASANTVSASCVKEYRWTSLNDNNSEAFRVARNSKCKDLNAWWGTQYGVSNVQVRGQYLSGGTWVDGSLGFRVIPSREKLGPHIPQVLIIAVKDGTLVRGQLNPAKGYIDQHIYYVH